MAQPPRHAETADFERSLHAVTPYAHACPLHLASLPHARPTLPRELSNPVDAYVELLFERLPNKEA